MRLAPAALTILLFAIAPASATAIQHVTPVYVVIVKGTPVPTPRRVAVHHSVTWFNNDKGAHRITSDHGRWPSFVLRYRKQHAVRFDRRGRYPYKVDGKAQGVIIVGAGGGGSSGGQTTTLYHYDVHVSGHAQSIRTYSGETRADWNGTETLTVDWTSDFSNVTLKKISDSGTFVIGHLGGGSARGTTDATYELQGDARRHLRPVSGDAFLRQPWNPSPARRVAWQRQEPVHVLVATRSRGGHSDLKRDPEPVASGMSGSSGQDAAELERRRLLRPGPDVQTVQ